MIGATIGPYRVIRELGQGGMASRACRGHAPGRRRRAQDGVRHQAGTAGGRAQLLDEARAAAALTDPAIAAVHDVIEHDGQVAIVFSSSRARRSGPTGEGPLPEDQAIHIAIQIADALSVAHAHGVLHRDLKPSNVMLAPGGVVKILDFGIARMRRQDAAVGAADQPGEFQGTPGTWRPSSGQVVPPTNARTCMRWAWCCSRWRRGSACSPNASRSRWRARHSIESPGGCPL